LPILQLTLNKLHIKNQTTLFFIRHGETQSNAKKIRQGVRIDDYLDTKGIIQVQKLTPIIEKLNLDILVTSYLHRAEESVALLKKGLNEPVSILHDYRLRERDFGSLTGKTQEEWDKILPGSKEKEKMQSYDYRPFGGENVEDVRQRTVGAILDLITNYDHRNIGIVAHNGPIRLILFHFPEIQRIYRAYDTTKDIANCDIYKWEITDGVIANLKSLLK
jgi:broad specificity phosphatase PhoE